MRCRVPVEISGSATSEGARKGQRALECVTRTMRGQGAIGQGSAGTLKGQGATEYLVLLAVVLIIALASVALLGWFPGTSTDARIAESQAYWRSASPIAIVEASAYNYWGSPMWNAAYIRLRNTGSYPIRLSGMIADNNASVRAYWPATNTSCCTKVNLTEITIPPGEEACFGNYGLPPKNCMEHSFMIVPPTYSQSGGEVDAVLFSSGPRCEPSGVGVLEIRQFGFEYSATIDGEEIRKRQVGTAPLIIRCSGVCNNPYGAGMFVTRCS